jgi:hypothetical protein
MGMGMNDDRIAALEMNTPFHYADPMCQASEPSRRACHCPRHRPHQCLTSS